MQPELDDHEPSGARRRLGLELRNLRSQAGLKGEDAAEAAETSKSRISRLENGTLKKFKNAEVKALLELYGVDDRETVQRFIELAGRARQATWIDDYDDVLPDKFESYVGLESDAVRIRAYTDQLVDGLLQTEAYARAVISAVRPNESPEAIDRLVELRMRRQQVFERQPPPALWTIMEEVVVRRPVGGKQVMGEQLGHLLEAAKLPNVTVQVLPYAEGAHAGLDGPFSILDFAEPDGADAVYVNSAAGNHYPKDAADFRDRFDLLRAAALSPDRTAAFIQQVKREMT